MELTIHHFHHFADHPGDELAYLARIERKLDELTRQEKAELMTLAELKAQVDANAQVESSAITLI